MNHLSRPAIYISYFLVVPNSTLNKQGPFPHPSTSLLLPSPPCHEHLTSSSVKITGFPPLTKPCPQFPPRDPLFREFLQVRRQLLRGGNSDSIVIADSDSTDTAVSLQPQQTLVFGTFEKVLFRFRSGSGGGGRRRGSKLGKGRGMPGRELVGVRRA